MFFVFFFSLLIVFPKFRSATVEVCRVEDQQTMGCEDKFSEDTTASFPDETCGSSVDKGHSGAFGGHKEAEEKNITKAKRC